MRLMFATMWLIAGLILGLGSTVWAADEGRVAADEQILRDAGVATNGAALLDFFRKRTIAVPDQEKLKQLVRQLGDDSFEMRERASNELARLGAVAAPVLREALRDPDPEVVHRARECLRDMQSGYSSNVTAAATRLLAVRKPAGTAATLLTYLPHAEDDSVAREVRQALAAVAVRDGRPDPVLVEGLKDATPAKRAGAAYALLRAGVETQRDAARRLLEDPEPMVRLHVGLALAAARDREAIPVLIDLLNQLPAAQTWPVEDLLYRLADDKGPTWMGGEDEARRRYREAWTSWWKENGAHVDLARAESPVQLGYTMVILLDQGTLLELDGANKVRWQIEGLSVPLDAQYLPGDKILVAEQGAGRVTERNLKGQVLWQRHVNDPLVAQRLPNGNTFIATRSQLLEFDPQGKEVFTRALPGELVMRAQKLGNGEIVCIASDTRNNNSRCFRFDASGKELHRFPVQVGTFGGRVEVLPNGNTLVPEKDLNRVVEYDSHGKIVWQIEVEQPIVASRLPSGNTLVTSMSQLRAIELDRSGKQVWDYRSTTRVTRAWRR
jgi:hypothetical protein